MRIYLDIETTYSDSPLLHAKIASEVTPPKTYTKPESIAKWHEEEGSKVLNRRIADTALEGGYGELTAVGWAIDDGDIEVRVRQSCETELDLLRQVAEDLQVKPQDYPLTFIGHNVDFDLRFLWKRAIVLGFPMPQLFPRRWRPWDPSILDMQLEWTGQLREYIKQAELAAMLGIETTDTITGADAPQAWRDGQYDVIRSHCHEDLRVCREIHRRMMAAGR